MNQTELQELYNACTGGDVVLSAMYGWYQSDNRDEEEIDFLETRSNYDPIDYAGSYLELAFEGIIDSLEWKLDFAGFYLLDPNFPTIYLGEYYLDLDSLWAEGTGEYADGSWSNCLSYGQLLLNVSSIVDLLWEYDGGAYQDTLRAQLTNLAGWAYLILQSEAFTSGTVTITSDLYPNTLDIGTGNGRIRLAAALGYAGCVLDSIGYIRTAEYDLFATTGDGVLPGSGLGLNTVEIMTSEGNLYNEGMSYTRYVMSALDMFLTARNRTENSGTGNTDNYNWFTDTNAHIKDIYESSMNLISPDLTCIPFDDVHFGQVIYYDWNNVPSGAFLRPESFSNMMTYYFQGNPTLSMESFIRGFVNRYYEKWGVYTQDYFYNRFYTYNDDRDDLSLSGTPQGFTAIEDHPANPEFTILRKTINTWSDFQESATLFVNHEHSSGVTSHEDSDQSSFILYYKGKQLLIDPGYRPSWFQYYLGKEWLESPFAHNLIMVDPIGNNDLLGKEADELQSDYYDYRTNAEYWNDPDNTPPEDNNYVLDVRTLEPSGETIQSGIAPEPAYRNYLISNSNVKHLQVGINYQRSQTDITRNFYAIDLELDDPYFLIYDDVINENTSQKDFYNQLHFALHPTVYNNAYLAPAINIDDIDVDSNGMFEYQNHYHHVGASPNNLPNTFLFGTMGSLNIAELTKKDSLPQGLYFGKKWSTHQDSLRPPQWEHKYLRAKTNTNDDEKFLTLLIPSENNTNPIEFVENYSNGYGVNYDLDTNDPYETYAAVYSGNTFFRFFQDEMQFNTSADFFLFKTNEDCSDIKKLILNGDNSFEVHDLVGTRFPDVLIFDSDYDAEEIIAEWTESNELILTFKTEWNDHPKYKILRCGVEPENLNATSYFDTYLNGTQPGERYYFEHIQSLAYDDNYFYVNYGYSDLMSENLLTSELTIHQGVFDGITIQGVTQFGTGDIVLRDEIPVPFGTEIVFLPGSQPQLSSNYHLIVDGNFTAIGTAENNIIFDKYSSTNWYKIEITNDGNANMEFCNFLNAQFPLDNKGYAVIENCEFQDNDRGIFLNSPTGYQIKNSIINNCNYFGILLKDSHILMYRSVIKNNLITNNNYGLWFYNASAYVEADTIFANRYAGILGNRGSNPVIVGSSISSTYYNDTNYPEIKIGGSSYPIVDRNGNDIIFGDGHSIYNMDISPQEYYCREVWWGTTNELAISNSFYPLNWPIDFTPISLSPNVGYNPWGGVSLFEEGLLAESNGDLITAKTKYTQSIDESPDGIEALWSASRLINCSETVTEYIELLQYYNQLQIDYTETDLAKAAKLDEVFCNRLLGNYQDAITEYEFLLNENLTFIDSVFTQLDIVYTYMEASSGGNRANVTFRNSENALSSVRQAEEREVALWGLLEGQITDGGIYSPEISKSILHRNYPNPFNPSTTISFSIPEQSKIQIMIYNIKGQKVKSVTNESFEKGNHSVVWNGVDDSGRNVSSGVYFYNLNVNGKSKAIKKCLLLK